MPAQRGSKAPASPAEPPKIPRPPNSWILFRSDTSQLLKSQGVVHQSEMSTTIALMWRNLHPTVKAEYERRAEVKKLEHQAAHPNYRFTPKSKETKAREKEEKKAKAENEKKAGGRQSNQTVHRSTGAVTHANPTVPLIQYPFPMPPTNPRWNPAGPSPPLSAASSPSPDDSGNESNVSSLASSSASNRVSMSRNASYDRTRSYYRDYSFSPQTHAPQPSVTQQGLPQQSTSSHYRTTSASSHHSQQEINLGHQQQQQQLQLQQYPSLTPQGYSTQPSPQQQGQLHMPSPSQVNGIGMNLPDQTPFDPLLDPLSQLNGMNTLDGQLDSSLFPFSLPNNLDQNFGMWGPSGFNPSMEQLLSNTSAADCFQMQSNGMDGFAGPLEVDFFQYGQLDPLGLGPLPYSMIAALGEQPLPEADGQNYLSGYMNNASSGNLGNMAGPSSQPFDAAQSAGFSSSSGTPEQSFQTYDELINYNDAFDFPQDTPAIEPQTSAQSTYMPPSGAAFSGNRRVAGSWPATFAMMEKTIDV
ncbi:MAT+ sexual cell fertilization-promoting factor [Hypsizygus marmoreus]|uniref:MAT+ sexual cell fertilization-promoting factor n=1 Tax=Hypsizygus marmoreus TaxID=39966 RepID=A0A369JVS7_HYPMA|nr:MAT+ sexual cell fertilization-promoting factor [Hypsizygus marmoreus]